MKHFSEKIVGRAFGLISLWLLCQHVGLAQCKEKKSESTGQLVHYHIVPLAGKDEYFTLSVSGEEKLFTYHNEKIDLVFHAQMFTEVRFTTPNGTFSLFATTGDRTRWKSCFMLSTPLTEKELNKMKGTTKIEILLPEDHKIFKIDSKKSELLIKGLACLMHAQT